MHIIINSKTALVFSFIYTILVGFSLEQLKRRNIPFAIGLFVVASVIESLIKNHTEQDHHEDLTKSQKIIKIIKTLYLAGIGVILFTRYRTTNKLSRSLILGALVLLDYINIKQEYINILICGILYSAYYLGYWQSFENPYE